MMAVGSLCTGIGGIDLGLERAGMRVAWQCEIDETCRKVLRRHWPHATLYGDIHDIEEVEAVDVLAAGYPCQPFSLAGKRGGENDPRHLWPEVWRVVQLARPRWLVLENVPGHLSKGFDEVIRTMAEGRYLPAWDVLTASQFGAPHLRRRVFIVPVAADAGRHRSANGEERDEGRGSQQQQRRVDAGGRGLDAADADGARVPERQDQGGLRQQPTAERGGPGDGCAPGPVYRADGWRWRGAGGFWSEAESPVLAVVDGLPRQLVGSRRSVLGAIGNTVIPQVAEWIGQRILAAEGLA